MALEIKVTQEAANNSPVYAFQTTCTKGGWKGLNVKFLLFYSPTGNCQIMSLRTFNSLQYFEDDEIVEIFKCMAKHCCKRCIMVDIKEIMYPLFKRIFVIKSDTILNAPFISTNGSKMRHIIFKLEKFRK